MKTLVIFGAKDLESIAARGICFEAGCATGTATYRGIPVDARTAYQADGYVLNRGGNCRDKQWERVIFFECREISPLSINPWLRCDHHNPNDIGYEVGPEDFWHGSSLGQLHEVLEISGPPTKHQLYTAAGDHCPADAYMGRCPGIDPQEFAKFRVAAKADPERAEKEIEKALEELRAAPEINGICDLRGKGLIPELPEAALKTGRAYMASFPSGEGGTKIVLGGHTTPKQVEDFMSWAKTLKGATEPYGNPTRGYAGVIVVNQ